MAVFFYCYRKFVSAEDLLKFLLDKINVNVNTKASTLPETCQYTLTALKYWTEAFPQDFANPNTAALLEQLFSLPVLAEHCKAAIQSIHNQLSFVSFPSYENLILKPHHISNER